MVVISDLYNDGPSTYCNNNPNFATICSFIEHFGELLGIQNILFNELEKMIENSFNGKKFERLHNLFHGMKTKKWLEFFVYFITVLIQNPFLYVCTWLC